MGRELKGGTASKGTRGEVWKLKGCRPDKEEVVGMARTGVGVELLWSLRPTDGDLLLVPLKNDFVCVCTYVHEKAGMCHICSGAPRDQKRALDPWRQG